MVEQFFAYEAVTSIALVRAVKTEARQPVIVPAGPAGSRS
jgi:hypothetical protein